MIPALTKIPTSTVEAKDASWFMAIPTCQQIMIPAWAKIPTSPMEAEDASWLMVEAGNIRILPSVVCGSWPLLHHPSTGQATPFPHHYHSGVLSQNHSHVYQETCRATGRQGCQSAGSSPSSINKKEIDEDNREDNWVSHEDDYITGNWSKMLQVICRLPPF